MFAASIMKRGHESVIAHTFATVRFVCDRGISHEIVRHRLASYSQESTRYCNYGKNGITLIHPPELTADQQTRREDLFWAVQSVYETELREGLPPQIARGVLPTALKTELVMTANFREWRHFFKLRAAPAAHSQLRELTIPLLAEFKARIPVLFGDIKTGE